MLRPGSRKIVMLHASFGAAAVVFTVQRGRHSSQSTGVAAGIVGVLDSPNPNTLSFDVGVGFAKERLRALADHHVYLLIIRQRIDRTVKQ